MSNFQMFVAGKFITVRGGDAAMERQFQTIPVEVVIAILYGFGLEDVRCYANRCDEERLSVLCDFIRTLQANNVGVLAQRRIRGNVFLRCVGEILNERFPRNPNDSVPITPIAEANTGEIQEILVSVSSRIENQVAEDVDGVVATYLQGVLDQRTP